MTSTEPTGRPRNVIVVGVDGSDGSSDAVRWTGKQAVRTGATVRIVGSWRWPNYVTRVPPGVDPAADTARSVGEAAALLARDHPDVVVTEHVTQGPPGPALLAHASGAELLVVGARGRAAFPGMLLGSVAEYCVRNGPCPVVVVRADTDV